MTRYHARWICPVSSSPIENGTLVEENGRIAYVGARAGAPAGGSDVGLGESILMPGLVNAHCHLELSAMRGFLDGLDFRSWIIRLTMARRAVMTTDMMLDASRLSIVEGLRHGVTTFADTGDSGTGFDAMLEYGVRGICYREVFGPDPAQCEVASAELVARVDDMLPRATELVQVGVSPHAPYTVSDALFRATADFARARALPVAVHIAESAIESELVVSATGEFAAGLVARGIPVAPRARSPIALLQRTGVLDRKPLLIHCVRVDADDIATIVSHQCGVAHCPASNAKLAHGIAPLAELMRAGANVGLGSDSVASNDRMALLEEARLAALFASVCEQRTNALSSAQAVELATLGGARALGLQAQVGSLEPGKAADIAVFPLRGERATVHDPLAALVYAMSGAEASLVLVNGQVAFANGAPTVVDPELPARVQRVADLLQAWRRSHEGPRAP